MRPTLWIALSGAFNRFTVSLHAALICFITRWSISSCALNENFFAGRIKDHFAERNSAQLSIFIQQPWNELIDWRRGFSG